MPNFTVEQKWSALKLMPFQWEPFNGDKFLEKTIKELKQAYNIKIAVELGACLGSSTIFFAENFEHVSTCEIDEKFAGIAQERLKERGLNDVNFWMGDSRSVLDMMLPYSEPAIVFIDSHWGPSNPLLQELEIIKKHGNKKLILIIHDFKVPDRDFQFDTYPEQGIVYEWSWIEAKVKDIWGDDFTVVYNREATGAKVGVVIIIPNEM